MSYGLKVQGSDTGGNFTVMDTDLNLLNMVVVDKGRASVISPQDLSSYLQPEDLLFVKRPTAPGEAEFQPVTIEAGTVEGRTIKYFYAPTYYFIEHDPVTGVIRFKGGDYGYVNTGDVRGSVRLAGYDDWDAEFDYFIVRKASTVIADGVGRDDQYGIKILTSSGEVSYDSRAAITNDTFSIETYLPASSQYFFGAYQGFNFSEGCYVNIEWARGYEATGGLIIRGIRIENTSAYVLDGQVVMSSRGPELKFLPNRSVVFAAKLNDVATTPPTPSDPETEEPPAPPSTDYSGTITYDSVSTFTEGGNIVFNATTNISAPYHIKVFRLTGSDGADGGDIVSSTSIFEGTSKTISIQSSNDTTQSSRTVSYQRDVNYIGNSTVNRVSSYTRGIAKSYTGDFIGDFVGNYTRTSSFLGNFTGDYSGQRGPYTRSLNFSRNYVGNFTNSRTSVYTLGVTRTKESAFSSYYVGEYDKSFVGDFVGNYTRSSSFVTPTTYEGNYTLLTQYIGDYNIITSREPREGIFIGPVYYTGNNVQYYAGDFTKIRNQTFYSKTDFTGDFISEFTRTQISTRVSSYVGPRTSIRYDVGNYSRNFIGDFVGDFVSTRTSVRVSSYTGPRTSIRYDVGNYSRNFIGDFVGDYSRSSTFTTPVNYIGNYTRNSAYTRLVFNNNPAEPDWVNIAITKPLQYEGNYSRSFVGNFTKIRPQGFSNTVGYTGNFTGDYITNNVAIRTAQGTFTRSFIGDFVSTTDSFLYVANNTKINIIQDFNTGGGDPFSPREETSSFVVTIFYNGVSIWSQDYSSFSLASNGGPWQAGGYWYHMGDLVDGFPFSTTGANYKVARTNSSATPSATTQTNRTRTSTVSRTGTIYYVGTRTSNVEKVSTRIRNVNVTSTGYFTRNVPKTYTSNYERYRVADFERNRNANVVTSTGYFTDYKNRTATYTGDFIGNYTGDFAGSRTSTNTLYFTGNLNRQLNRTRISTLNFEGNYTGDFAGSRTINRTLYFTGNITRQLNRTRISTVQYLRTLYYNRNVIKTSTQDFQRQRLANFTRTRSANVVTSTGYYTDYINRTATFIGDFIGNYLGNYTGTIYYAGTTTSTQGFSRDVLKSYIGVSSTRVSNYFRPGTFEGNYQKTSTVDYTDEINRTQNFTAIFTGTYGGQSQQTFTGNFVGNYVGDFARNATATTSGTSELGWAGETFSIELRLGDTTEAVNAPRGSEGTLDSKTFTLYDNDSGTILSTTSTRISDQDTTHKVEFNFSTEGNSSVTGRISTSGVIVSGPFAISSGANTITVNNVPTVGGNKTYSLYVNKGDGTEIFAGSYTVYRSATNDPAPAPAPAPSPAPAPAPEPEPGPSQPNDNIAR